LIYVISGLAAAGLLAFAFTKMSARALANTLRYAAPALLTLFGLGLTLAGRAGLGMTLIGIAAALFARVRQVQPMSDSSGRRSHVRSAALEMELDLDSGDMNGLVLAGRFEGAELDAMADDDLAALYDELSMDEESRQLLEAYLDRRIAGWRERFDMNGGDGLGGAPGTGPMTEQEAHEILGLGAGATEADVREAHRRLMKRVHPDAGGSASLAARINEAKDFLLRRHR
jgi:hypothetical protein